MGREWRTFLKPSAGLPPTRWVGESGVSSSGCAASMPLQLVHQRVVVGVGDLRRVENVVEVLVAAQFGAQFFGALGRDRCLGWFGSPMG